ncbi:nitrile hydratase accessory protein [Salinihabitans flavidus]|uniref:Nitrile hydratase accessory protein n=1 Tax=Salinihabitans flavidus TaxID=569882 RepID=A0A1H8RB08_9RHOB|nr:nitrile hydratase accessory protein [Salinihabitans flavidus]SEO63552.1 nitrile hydratase accessory protein [Salinihabitans flavidus]
MSDAPEPVFEAPWHAQVFAITVSLNEAGLFSWPEWTQVFGATLARHGLAKELNGGEDYFAAWLEALEAVLAEKGIAASGAVEAMRAAWEEAYLSTPHGTPVKLRESG